MVAVSIVMPAYMAADFISEAILSVQNQSFVDWELLVTDDASSDNTTLIVEGFAEKDPRIKIFRQEKNGGAWLARNRSLEAAKGRYLAFLDSDDLWPSNKLCDTLNFMHRNEVSFCFTAFTRFESDPASCGTFVAVPSKTTYSSLLGDNVIATSTVVIDRQTYPNIRMPESYYDDFACWLGILCDGGIARGINQPLMYYRKTKGSLSRNKLKSAKMVWKALRHEQQLILPRAFFHFLRYSINGVLKHYLTEIYNFKSARSLVIFKKN